MKSNSPSEEKVVASSRSTLILNGMDKLYDQHKVSELITMKTSLKNALNCLPIDIKEMINAAKSRLQNLNSYTYVSHNRALDEIYLKLQTCYDAFLPHLKDYNEQMYKLLNEKGNQKLHKVLKDYTVVFYDIIDVNNDIFSKIGAIEDEKTKKMEHYNLKHHYQ